MHNSIYSPPSETTTKRRAKELIWHSLCSHLLLLLLATLCCLQPPTAEATPADIHVTESELQALLDLHRGLLNQLSDLFGRDEPGFTSEAKLVNQILQHPSTKLIQGTPKNAVLTEHPVNLFILYKLWHESAGFWKSIYMKCDIRPRPDNIEQFIERLPNNSNVEDVALSLLRLQNVYNLSTSELVESGTVINIQAVRGLDKDECFFVAEVAAKAGIRQLYKAWTDEGLKKVTFQAELKARQDEFAEKLSIVEDYLNEKSGDSDKAVEGTFAEVADLVNADELKQEKNSTDKVDTKAMKAAFYESFKGLCQMSETSSVVSYERCMFYSSVDQEAFYLLAPHKLEFHSYDPLVVTFHDILSESVMNDIKEGAKMNLEVPRSFHGHTGNVQVNNGRTGKVAFLKGNEKGLSQVNSLSERLTGLNMEHTEPLQVVSYGIGGHYEPHVDYFNLNGTDRQVIHTSSGDRIATLLYYLNDVTYGGATVFPRLGLSVKPSKGGALFWYNLYKNGTGDFFTLHAGCPVLLGSKWIANHWFHEYGQEFTRSCGVANE